MKNLSYWLKGGIIGVIINTLLFGADYILFYSRGIPLDAVLPFTLVSFLITDGLYLGRNTPTAVWIFSSLVFFVIFAVIGWIYGKIKNRKNVK